MNPTKLKKHVLDMVYNKKSGHIGGSFSIASLIAYLYDNYNLAHTVDEPGDLLVLSKGHAAPILYAAQIEAGLFPESMKDTFREIDSPFQGHPDVRYNKYVHATTGSLGQGLSIACGMALAKKLKGDPHKVFCILGDGECDEGQIYESISFAQKQKLDNLWIIVDSNGLQNDGNTIYDTINQFQTTSSIYPDNFRFKMMITDKPHIFNLRSAKGEGVSFMENKVEWHSKVPTTEEYNLAMEELNEKL